LVVGTNVQENSFTSCRIPALKYAKISSAGTEMMQFENHLLTIWHKVASIFEWHKDW
jgi:hypothetical protein